MDASPAPAIRFQGVSFAYRRVPVLEGITFTVPQGEFLTLIGPNGGGKTTILKLMLGLLTPQSGSVEVLGRSPSQVSGRVGYVPQDPGRNQNLPVSVMDVVLMGRISRGKRRRIADGDREKAEAALDKVEMGHRRNERMGELSQGQRQRVLIARALASEPSLLLLDEPTASTDPNTKEAFHALLGEMQREMTIVLVSHDVTVISSNATAVACVNRTLYYHDSAELESGMIQRAYGACPVEIIAHGMPHRVLAPHNHPQSAGRGAHA
ncbi:MAG: metal ABC transporter ATP-binding protein [Synergistales bacterium]|nr:metal ABC transporter ATP-binding protein [Synergistales bacterium]